MCSSDLFWSQSPEQRELTFARLRGEAPISWQERPESTLGPGSGRPFWAVMRHADVVSVARAPDVFSSARGVRIDDMPPEFQEKLESMLVLDNPRHAAVRRIVSAAFTPKAILKLEQRIETDVRKIVDDLADDDAGDFVERVARRLPMMTVLRMLGVDDDRDCERLEEITEITATYSDPEILGDRQPAALIVEMISAFHQIADEMTERRRREPADDIITGLVRSEAKGLLDHDELRAFFTLLSVAASDTTKHTASGGLLALTRYPNQRKLLLEDLPDRIGPAVEEMVRWMSPVATMRRTATRDTVLSGTAMAEGDDVVLFYRSANRDETVFSDPNMFDIMRSPNPHLGFGGGGPHFCLGAWIARVSLRALFTNLLATYPDIEVGEPRWITSNLLNGIYRIPMSRGARAR